MLRIERREEGTFGRCPSCEGLWLDHHELRLRATPRPASGSEAAVAITAAGSSAEPLPCPRCGVTMAVRTAAPGCDVEIDVCEAHGLWLDARELPGLRAFVHAGGLDGVRRQRPVVAATPVRRMPVASTGASGWDLVDGLLLLDFLADL